jgi:hypothetical protein
LAVLWFPAEERQKAQAVGFLGTYLGAGASYLISPCIVHSAKDIPLLIIIEACMALVPTIFAFAYFPETPTSGSVDESSVYHEAIRSPDAHFANSDNEMEELADGQQGQLSQGSMSFRESFILLSKSGSFLLLLLSAGLLHGVFATWGAAMALSLSSVGVVNARADLMAFSATMLYVVGTQVLQLMRVFLPTFYRRFRRKWLSSKSLLLLLLVLTVGSFTLFCLTVPTFWFPDPPLRHYIDAVAITGFHGLIAGATAPVFMELSGEVTHPVSEEVSANLIGLFINFTHVSAFVFFTYVRDLSWLCAFVFGTYALCLVVFLPVVCSCFEAMSFYKTALTHYGS